MVILKGRRIRRAGLKRGIGVPAVTRGTTADGISSVCDGVNTGHEGQISLKQKRPKTRQTAFFLTRRQHVVSFSLILDLILALLSANIRYVCLFRPYYKQSGPSGGLPFLFPLISFLLFSSPSSASTSSLSVNLSCRPAATPALPPRRRPLTTYYTPRNN